MGSHEISDDGVCEFARLPNQWKFRGGASPCSEQNDFNVFVFEDLRS
jgi:hypothetical protein